MNWPSRCAKLGGVVIFVAPVGPRVEFTYLREKTLDRYLNLTTHRNELVKEMRQLGGVLIVCAPAGSRFLSRH
jgi:hypothetical protein